MFFIFFKNIKMAYLGHNRNTSELIMTLQVVADFMPNWRNGLDDSINAGTA